MEFSEAKAMFPRWSAMHRYIKEHHLEHIRIVPSQDLTTYSVPLVDLPERVRFEVTAKEGFSGFDHGWSAARFVIIGGRAVPNIAYRDSYKSLLDVSFETAVGDVHWVWFARNRKTLLSEAENKVRWMNPQTNYLLEDGNYRRIATSTLLLGPDWENSGCPCGSSCLRPDHWHQRHLGPGRGRKPRMTIRIARGTRK